MNSRKPMVSVIIPVYNCELFIAQALDSVCNQIYRPLEIIVVNDGSTDSSADIVHEIISKTDEDMKLVCQVNKGPAAARNRGLGMAKGDLITFLDADDLWHRRNLEWQLSLLTTHHGTEIVIGYSQSMRITGQENGKPIFQPFSVPALILSLSCAIVRRSVFDKVGGFDETQRHGDDWDWYMRAREMGITIKIHEAVVHYYRRHENNLTNSIEVGNQHTLQMLKKSLDRRRQQGGEARSLPSLVKKDG